MASAPTPALPNGEFVALPDTTLKPTAVTDDSAIYRFWKVEDFFAGFENVVPSNASSAPIFDGMASAKSSVEAQLKDVQVNPSDPLTLQVILTDGSLMLLEAIRYDTVRIRWNPAKRNFSDYSQHLSRSIVMNTLGELRQQIASDESYKLTAVANDLRSNQDGKGARFTWSIQKDGMEWMNVIVYTQVFAIEIWRDLEPNLAPNDASSTTNTPPKKSSSLVWSTTAGNTTANKLPVLSRQDPEGNYATCLTFNKNGKHMGFGEQGGFTLLKDRQMLNLYNYDNIAYSSVYGQQAVNPAEPLYHSDPFGVELNGVAGMKSAVGVYVDDYSQVLLDLGSKDPSVMRVGSRFADMEVHITCADDLRHACLAHSSCVGRGKLFPRWVLGYQQGCYGYDTKEKVLAAAAKYRQYNIPLDGMHVDVDLQNRYRTFTMDSGQGAKFQDAKDMFTRLTNLGIKASTNITPVISSQDEQGRNYWEQGSQARQNYKSLDSGLTQNVFVKDQRWNQQQNPPTYSYYEGGQLNTSATKQAIPNLNTPAGQSAEYRGGVSYGPDLGTPGVYPDLGRKEVRKWWGQQYADLFDAGLSMVWQDMTTPAIMTGVGDMKTFPFRLLLADDSESARVQQGILSPALKIQNLFSYNLHKATYHGVAQLPSRKGLRNFIIGRGSFTGQHRFAGLWTGDNTSSYDFLRINIQQVISCGIGGTVITGADVGGFEAYPWESKWCDPQLLIRWTLANALLPWFRNHYMGKTGRKMFQEPYAYYEHASLVPSQTALYQAVLPICRYYILIRYTLMQLLYDAYFSSLFDGRSVAQSLLATDPWDLSLLDNNSGFLAQQYFVGEGLLIAPVLHSEEELAASSYERNVYLPSGSSYYDFNLHLAQTNNDIVKADYSPAWTALDPIRPGGQIFSYISSIDRYAQGDSGHLPYLLPMFVRQNSIIPTQSAEAYSRQLKPNPLTIHLYPGVVGNNNTYDLFLDDGVSLASAPAQLPQFKLDKQSGAQSDYRQWRVSQSVTRPGNEKTRTLKIELVQKKYDVKRTTEDIGGSLTLQIWHDGSDLGSASSARFETTRSGNSTETLPSRYDGGLNATILTIPVDDEPQRKIVITYSTA